PRRRYFTPSVRDPCLSACRRDAPRRRRHTRSDTLCAARATCGPDDGSTGCAPVPLPTAEGRLSDEISTRWTFSGASPSNGGPLVTEPVLSVKGACVEIGEKTIIDGC